MSGSSPIHQWFYTSSGPLGSAARLQDLALPDSRLMLASRTWLQSIVDRPQVLPQDLLIPIPPPGFLASHLVTQPHKSVVGSLHLATKWTGNKPCLKEAAYHKRMTQEAHTGVEHTLLVTRGKCTAWSIECLLQKATSGQG